MHSHIEGIEISETIRKCFVGYALNSKKLRKSGPEEDTKIPEDRSKMVPNKMPPYYDLSYPTASSDIEVTKPSGPHWRGGGLADILSKEYFCNSDSEMIEFIPWDPDLSPRDQPEVHVLIHKLTEDIEREESQGKIDALKNYLNYYPKVVLLDRLECVREVTNRARTCQRLLSIQSRLGVGCPFAQPPFLIIDSDKSPSDIYNLMINHSIDFPVICKPLEACGTPLSHSMVVVVSAEDFKTVPLPCILQQYYNHGGVFNKVYVIDEGVSVYQRTSLPNLTMSSGICSVSFDSRKNYPKIEDFYPSDIGTLSIEPARPISGEDISLHFDDVMLGLFRESAMEIRAEFGLTLFGFDVLISDKNPNKLLVVDVNYFPSYKEVTDFPDRLVVYLRKLAAQSSIIS